ncbi:MAG: PorV/PorQ family protein [Ignavibacteria bacterium]|nr:PorV/PorQ family protein [Ignavibacteria bacterium]
MLLHKYLKIMILGWAICSGAIHSTALAQPGKSGLSFLKLGVSARGLSMADAMSAHVTGSSATFYNPAGLPVAQLANSTSQLTVMHKEWIQDTRTEFLGASALLDEENAIGFSINSTTISDIEIRTRPGPSEGTFTARNFSFGASYGRILSEQIRVGITAKFLYEKILIDEASGFAVDIGTQYQTPIENLSVGAVLANLGGMSTLRNEKSSLPTLLRIGPGYSTELVNISSDLTLASDLVYVFPENRSYVSLGGELLFSQTIAARAGYRFGSDGRGFTTGIGVQYSIIFVDYAFAPLSADLGNTHTISLSLNL